MSTQPKNINGDLSVSRNASVGGNVNAQGDLRVGHNVKVGGWLDAKNIKYPCKGLFTDLPTLQAAYPSGGERGWYALVGKSLPAAVYIWTAMSGWVPTGGTGGDPAISVDAYETQIANALQKATDADSKADDAQAQADALAEDVARINAARSLIILDGQTTDGVTKSTQGYWWTGTGYRHGPAGNEEVETADFFGELYQGRLAVVGGKLSYFSSLDHKFIPIAGL